ncbi:MAG: hypothetical protein ACP5KA_05560 [Desulfurococcaceae archaeon]
MTAEHQPKLIVTCRAGNEELCIHEICNVLYSKDPCVKAEKTKYSGVVFVYTSLSADKAYKASSLREYGFVENIVPVHCVLDYPVNESALLDCLKSIVKSPAVRLKVKARGVRGASSALFSLIARLLAGIGSAHTPESSTCLYVEVVESKMYVGVAHCRSVFKHSL